MSTPLQPVPTNRFIVMDTSVWISALMPTDPNHAAAMQWLNRHVKAGGSLLAPTLLVIETASGLARATGQPVLAQRAASRLYSLPFMRIVSIDQSLVNETVSIAATYKLRGADAVFVALAKIEGLPLVSFDQEQLTRPTDIVTTIRP